MIHLMITTIVPPYMTSQLWQQALDGTDLTKISTPIYRFFNNRCKLPIPHLQVETGSIIDESNKAKYDRIIKYSHSKEQRKFFLSCGLLPLWHKQGWHCPQSVYRWLMEIVAFDKDIETARKAKTIVYALWSKMPREKLCMQPTTGDDINYSRFMSLETFNYILKGYGALDLSTMDDDTDTLMEKDDLTDKIPLTQFEWTLQLLQRSLDLWPEAYTNQQIHSLATTLICMGIDGIGVLALKHIQDTLDTCLSVFTEDTWRLQLQQLAYHLIERFTSIELRVRLPTVTKTIYPRSLYLRRVMAVMSLEAALYKDKMDERELTFGDVSLSLAFDNELIPRLAAIVDDSGGIFQQTDPDYCQISDRIYLLDYAVGNDYAELMASIDAVNSIVTQLQAFSRKIGKLIVLG
ncbi:hypothetical protein BC941DRAFT_416064 [Chlamydoabsidia padenii]|nr:hypothetical protein BC941DRAFT_416064 [Chlamydoabsidia padenii]